LPSAATSFVCAPFDRSQAKLPCNHVTRPTLPHPPHPIPTFVTMANAPARDGTAGVLKVIWVNSEAKYFCKGGWTGKSLICPSGKISGWAPPACLATSELEGSVVEAPFPLADRVEQCPLFEPKLTSL
jgi:hypothetical protein